MVVKKQKAKETKENHNPTHYIKMYPRDKRSPVKGTIGKGWWNEDKESFSIRLNVGVTISWRDDVDFTFIAFPIPAE